MNEEKYTVYHNARCSKSRCALDYLDENQTPYEVVDYLKNPLKTAEIKTLLKQIGMPASQLIRKGEPEFIEHFKGKELSEKEWIAAMVKFPKLIERPIIVKNGKAVIGRPTERIEELG